ncbi:hypothetical protein BEP19_03535 [Ammoniphilus oxalaticus]|uniref:Uncharacterized protein n=1 Tax=Ammoniphilus oxalaticus TaxID=66863 RepID=A0A419SP61_9BACL|nr:hypothetical protein [Ammoniphilus oxalaticus]RKD26009.1 hypothetical protein BEP19_03535 [Ammoniphilus oxalaticus]
MKKRVAIGVISALFIVGIIMFIFPKQSVKEVEHNDVAYIQPAELSDETKRILSGVGLDPGHVFEYEIHPDASFMRNVWIEVYENGIRQEDATNFSGGGGQQLENENALKEYVAFFMEHVTEERTDEGVLAYTISTIHDSGSGRTPGEINLSKGGTFTAPLSEKREIEMNRPITLITMINDGGNGISYSTSDAIEYDESGEVPKFIQRYEKVLLFRVQFVEEEIDESYYDRIPLDDAFAPTE